MNLSQIQRELNAPKTLTNKFGGYKYRSAECILEALKPLLGEGSLVISDEIVMVGERIYVKATATHTFKGEVNVATGFAREPLNKKGSDESQITGAASSYARKYAMNGLFCIDDNKDADATNDHGTTTTAKPKPKPAKKQPAKPAVDLASDTQVQNIETMFKKVGTSTENIAKAVKAYSGNRTDQVIQLTQPEAAKLIGKLTEKVAAK